MGACEGSIGSTLEEEVVPPLPPGVVESDPIVPGALRQLSPQEINATLRDLLAELDLPTDAPGVPLAEPDTTSGFSNTSATGHLTLGQLQGIGTWAENVSAGLAASSIPCGDEAAWSPCLADFSQRLARLAFRRPATAEELANFETIYTEVRTDEGTAEEGYRALIEFAVQVPDFWYLSNETNGAGQLLSHAAAGRLSYFLWGTMPDQVLRDAADAVDVFSADEIRAQAERMLDDERAHTALDRFHREWLHVKDAAELVKDGELFPMWSTEMAADLETEFAMFVERMSREGSVAELLSSRYSYVNQRLEPLYGLSPMSSGNDDWVWRELGAERAGVLTRPLFLASTAGTGEPALIHRGAAVLQQVLCATLQVPEDVSSEAVDLPTNATSDKLLGVENRASKPVCAGCHNTIDPIGLTFEAFDAIGGIRDRYPDGVFIETAGTVPASRFLSETVPYNTAAEMMTGLAALPDAQQCYAQQWLHWASGQPPTDEQMAEVERIAVAGEVSIRELLLELASSPAFLERTESP